MVRCSHQIVQYCKCSRAPEAGGKQKTASTIAGLWPEQVRSQSLLPLMQLEAQAVAAIFLALQLYCGTFVLFHLVLGPIANCTFCASSSNVPSPAMVHCLQRSLLPDAPYQVPRSRVGRHQHVSGLASISYIHVCSCSHPPSF